MSYKTIDRSLKTTFVGAFPVNSYFRSKSVQHDVILTSFVADLWYSVLKHFHIMYKIVAWEGTASLVVIGLEDIARKREGLEIPPSGAQVKLRPEMNYHIQHQLTDLLWRHKALMASSSLLASRVLCPRRRTLGQHKGPSDRRRMRSIGSSPC